MTCHGMPRHDMPCHDMTYTTCTTYMHVKSPNYEGGNYAGFSAAFSHPFCEGVNYAGFSAAFSHSFCEGVNYAGFCASWFVSHVRKGELCTFERSWKGRATCRSLMQMPCFVSSFGQKGVIHICGLNCFIAHTIRHCLHMVMPSCVCMHLCIHLSAAICNRARC